MDDLTDVARLYVALKRHHARLQPSNIRYQVDDERWFETARRSLSTDQISCFVALAEDRTVAFMKLSFVKKVWGISCEIETLIVDEGARGLGIGSHLIATAEDEARRRGAVAMRVDVLSSNDRGLAFYERKGYEPFAVRYGKSL